MRDAAAAQQALDASPFGPWWGFQVESVGSGRAQVRLPARPELFRPGGVLQGGCAMTLADVAFWIAIMATIEDGEAAVTLEQTSTFLGAARTDLICDAQLLRTGRTVLYGTAMVRDTRAALVTHHTLTYMRSTTPAGTSDS
jgi:uncharacterized protein (TIGR00369 family)